MTKIQLLCTILVVSFCTKWTHGNIFGGRLQEIEKKQQTWKPKENVVFANRDEGEMKRFLGINLQKKEQAQRQGARMKGAVRTPTSGHKGRGGYGTGRGKWHDTNRYKKNYWEQGSNRRGFGSQGSNGKWNWGQHGARGGGNGHGNGPENRGNGGRGSGPEGRGNGNDGRGNGNDGRGNGNDGRANGNDGRGNGNDGRGNGNDGRGNGPQGRGTDPENRGPENRGGGNGGRGNDNRSGENHAGGNGGGGKGNENRGGNSRGNRDGHHGRLRRAVLPENFDWRDYSDCQSLDDIRYQQCGDCWAVASASVMSDRYCLWTHQEKFFSARQLTTCGYPGEGGCDGGWPKDAMEIYKTKGVASGGDPTITDEKKGCLPYPDELNNADQCPSACDDKSALDVTKAGDYYEITSKNVTEIMQEIYDYGPVVTIFEVFDDFGYMGSGIYKHVSGTSQGYHAIRLIGYGTENGVPYWLAANTWGPEWGDKGYFKFLRGQNHCDIESWVTCVYPAEAYK